MIIGYYIFLNCNNQWSQFSKFSEDKITQTTDSFWNPVFTTGHCMNYVVYKLINMTPFLGKKLIVC